MYKYFRKNKSVIVAFALIAAFAITFLSCSKNNNTVAPPVTGGTLTLSIDTSLDDGANVVITGNIEKVDLYKFSAPSTIIKSAAVNAGVATFDMTGLTNGDYFMVVNDSSGERLPTHIEDYTQNYHQKVGKELRISIILSNSADTLYKIKAHTQNQGEHEVIKYSNDQGTGRYMFAFVTYATKTLELRYLDDGSVFNNLVESTSSHHTSVFPTWILGKTNHGTGPDGDSVQVVHQCMCHTNFWVKPAQWNQITFTHGWCYRCHAGYHGDDDGFYDRNQ